MGKNYDLANLYGNAPLTVEIYSSIKNSINYPCRRYVLGHAYIAAKAHRREPNEDFEDFGNEFGYSNSSLEKFASYAKGIDYIHSFAPELVERIMDGGVRLSMENTLQLVQKKRSDIFRIIELLEDDKVKVSDVFPCRKRKANKVLKQNDASSFAPNRSPTIKDIPAYDPDAPISSLSYTVPSWVGAIEKVFIGVDFTKVSAKARYRLRKEIVILADTAEVMLNMLREDK